MRYIRLLYHNETYTRSIFKSTSMFIIVYVDIRFEYFIFNWAPHENSKNNIKF